MTDLVQRLRQESWATYSDSRRDMLTEAAARIEALESERITSAHWEQQANSWRELFENEKFLHETEAALAAQPQAAARDVQPVAWVEPSVIDWLRSSPHHDDDVAVYLHYERTSEWTEPLYTAAPAQPPGNRDELKEAAHAVIARWDTPLWKGVPHTGEFIDRLRAALAKADAP